MNVKTKYCLFEISKYESSIFLLQTTWDSNKKRQSKLQQVVEDLIQTFEVWICDFENYNEEPMVMVYTWLPLTVDHWSSLLKC